MKIAIIGTRGIPARYGGFETFAEELGKRLAERGHDVVVYCRTYNDPDQRPEYLGVRLVHLPTVRHKYLDTIAHTVLSILHGMFQRFDVVLVCNAANSPFIPLLRIVGQKVAVNVDGIERKRKKWNATGRLWYWFGEYLATVFASRVVSDAQVIREYYLKTYKSESTVISYGARSCSKETSELERFNLAPKSYVLYVSRLEPENNAHKVVEAFEGVETDRRLVVVGDAPYSHEYIARLRQTADDRILFTGAVYGEGYEQLQGNAYCYVQATEVGGTHPALLEAMGAGNCVIANGTPENIEVLANAGLLYAPGSVDDLRAKMQQVLDDTELAATLGDKARARVETHYTWAKVTDDYEALFDELLGRPAPEAE